MKKINVVVQQTAEQVLESAYCDACGKMATSATVSTSPIGWGSNTDTVCWKTNYTTDESKELILCPDCFDRIYDFVKGGGTLQLPRKHLRVVK